MYGILAWNVSIRIVAWIVMLVLSVHSRSPETSIKLGKKKRLGVFSLTHFKVGNKPQLLPLIKKKKKLARPALKMLIYSSLQSPLTLIMFEYLC